MENNYPKAYKEVIEVLKFVPKEYVDKIPQSMINTFNEKMDQDYEFSIDINKNLEEELLVETKAIFANIFRDYWATEYQKEEIEAEERYNRQKNEEEKREKYNINIFEQATKTINVDATYNTELTEYKDSFFIKLKKFLLKILHIN